MENKNLPSKPQQNFSPPARIEAAMQDEFIRDVDIERVKECIRYGIVILGIPADRIPDEVSKSVLLNYCKTAYGNMRVSELKLAFDFAAEKRTDCITTLYPGEYLSAKFIGGIVAGYLLFRNVNRAKKVEDGAMNNGQRLEKIIDILKDKPETLETLKEIGKKPEYQPTAPRKRTEQEELIQGFFREFDRLYRDKPTDVNEAIRTVEVDGIPFTQADYVEYRLNEHLNQKP